jgi:hypothetical protein
MGLAATEEVAMHRAYQKARVSTKGFISIYTFYKYL